MGSEAVDCPLCLIRAMLGAMSMQERDEWLMATFLQFVDEGLDRVEISSRIQDIFLFDDRRLLKRVVNRLYRVAEELGFLQLVSAR